MRNLTTLALMVLLCGCASNPAARERLPDRTDGLDLRLYIEMNEHTAVLYRVRPEGTLSFGGGRDAFFGHMSWTGDMTDEEIAQLHALLDEHAWFVREPRSNGEPQDYRIEINATGSQRARARYRIQGKSAAVEPIADFLSQIALRRLQPELDRLPQATPVD